jgi:clan AA aspartic protease
MGKVMTKLIIENVGDRLNAESGLILPSQVRRIEVEALVDTGATTLVLPADLVAQLGLPLRDRRTARLADGTLSEVARVTGMHIEILGRDMTGDALVVPAGATPLIGQVQLEMLDLVVDPRSQELRPNPRSPDAPMYDLLAMRLATSADASAA